MSKKSSKKQIKDAMAAAMEEQTPAQDTLIADTMDFGKSKRNKTRQQQAYLQEVSRKHGGKLPIDFLMDAAALDPAEMTAKYGGEPIEWYKLKLAAAVKSAPYYHQKQPHLIESKQEGAIVFMALTTEQANNAETYIDATSQTGNNNAIDAATPTLTHSVSADTTEPKKNRTKKRDKKTAKNSVESPDFRTE